MSYEIQRLKREIEHGESYLQKSPWPEWFYSGIIMGLVGGLLMFAINTSDSPELRTMPQWIKWFFIYFAMGALMNPLNRFITKLSMKKNKKKLFELTEKDSIKED